MIFHKARHKIVFLSLTAAAISLYAFARGDEGLKTIFYKANAMYKYAEYKKAVKEYNKIIGKDWESAFVYYNLGNCYFKMGKLGKAILNYEKARRLNPCDSDLESNYKYACSLVKGGFIKDKRGWLIRLSDKLFSSLTIDGLSILLSIIYIVVLLTIIISLYNRAVKQYRRLIIAVLAFLFIFALVDLYSRIFLIGKEAIVVVEKTDAKFEPLKSSTTYFTLYEGTKVFVVSKQGRWYKIKRIDGKTGWIGADNVEIF